MAQAAAKTRSAAGAAKGRTLVIVESPSKAKTIGRYLGSGYRVVASVGHVRDLPKSKLGIDIENGFEPQYISIRGKGEVIKNLRAEARKAGKVYLATDPDREGEAISWHLATLLGIDPGSPCRVTFNEITRDTVKAAIKNPRAIDLSLVDAQQARRVLDRLVGYEISPLLWRKIRRGLSAGRVQSAALKIICDREREIKAFVPEEYWNIYADFIKDGTPFTAKVVEYKGKKFSAGCREDSDNVLGALRAGDFDLDSVKQKERLVRPQPPFTTSSLQQDAGNRLGFNTRRTMMVAQQLYEGVDIRGRGSTGLITYLRTDSVRIAETAKAAASEFINENYGRGYAANNVFSNRKKDIQDAHEAIRPADVRIIPQEVKASLSADQYKLYTLIWQRFMASQMAPARYNATQADMMNGDYRLRATGSELIFDGFRKVYKPHFEGEEDRILPPLEEGERLKAEKVYSEQAFTKPPARYTEASLVRELEEKNIGRPSTYAPIVGTLTERKYVSRDKRALVPTELGFVVDELMEAHFHDIVDAGFTAEMEDRLDDIELGRRPWRDVVGEFYGPFDSELKAADEAIEKVTVEDQPTGELCELCGRPMVLKMGRYGEFAACSGYPECRNTKPIVKGTGVRCPNCGREIVARRSRRGRTFYGCSGYPECSTVFWNRPVNRKCPRCGSLLLEKRGRGGLMCSNPECGYTE